MREIKKITGWFPNPDLIEVPQRSIRVDTLRGLAIAMMLIINLGVMADSPPITTLNGTDWFVAFITLLFVQGKAYPLFAFLFGWGLARIEISHSIRYRLRRLLILAVIGLFHGLLLWEGDVLFLYAVIGLLMGWSRRIPARWLLGLAMLLILLESAWMVPLPGIQPWQAYVKLVSSVEQNLHSAASGDIPILLKTALVYLRKMVYAPLWAGTIVGLILLGYLAGSRRLAVHMPPFLLLTALAVIFNFAFALFTAFPALSPTGWGPFFRSLSINLGGPLLAFVFARLIWSVRPGSLTFLAYTGRMPLTAYISQTLIILILLGYGIGRSASPRLVWSLSIVIFASQTIFARIWFKIFERGPLEHLWRKLAGDESVWLSPVINGVVTQNHPSG